MRKSRLPFEERKKRFEKMCCIAWDKREKKMKKTLFQQKLENIIGNFKHYILGEDVLFTDREYFPIKRLYYID